MATAELALAIPTLLLVLALCLTGLTVLGDQVRCVDAARAAARAASRGETTEQVEKVALALAPTGSDVSITTSASDATVLVTVRAPSRAAVLPGSPRASSTARAPIEPVLGSSP